MQRRQYSLGDWFSNHYLQESTIKNMSRQFNANKPYPHLELKNFFREEIAVNALKALSQAKFSEKDADLFHIYQTNDISSMDDPFLQDFRAFFLSNAFLSYMTRVTGLHFKRNKIDLHGAIYSNTCYLLCHDDQLEGRSIAFMWYLSNLKNDYGGSLLLYDKKFKTTKKIIPQFNSFVFFQVSPFSFHEVEEVKGDVQRITLGGWLHDK